MRTRSFLTGWHWAYLSRPACRVPMYDTHSAHEVWHQCCKQKHLNTKQQKAKGTRTVTIGKLYWLQPDHHASDLHMPNNAKVKRLQFCKSNSNAVWQPCSAQISAKEIEGSALARPPFPPLLGSNLGNIREQWKLQTRSNIWRYRKIWQRRWTSN